MISVVVPIYNEEEIILLFHRAVANAMASVNEAWEVVYVNDGSADASLELLREVQLQDPHVVVVDLSRNWGHMGALAAGLRTAQGDAVILMDGDFQDPPEVLPELVKAWGLAHKLSLLFAGADKNSASTWPFYFRSFIACSAHSPTIPFR